MSANAAASAALEAREAASVTGDNYQSILRNPKFQELVSSRNTFGWTLGILMLIIYFGFILLVAYDKSLLAEKVGGGTTSLGIVLGLAVIVIAFILTAIYVVRANGRYDELTRELKEEMGP
jgi:uncharacterized membrane protein (DUF485 family)